LQGVFAFKGKKRVLKPGLCCTNQCYHDLLSECCR